jgi:hypothetical protein
MTAALRVKTESRTRNWKSLLVLGALLLCPTLCIAWYWQRIVTPPRLTKLYSQEFAPVITTFEAMELSLDVQLHPEHILLVATKEYLERHLSIAPPLNCAECDRFWVTTSAEANQICVLDYSADRSVVRASVKQTGHRINAVTYEPLSPESAYYYRSTYHLIKEDGAWKVTRITDYISASKGQTDIFTLIDERLSELGCP